MQDQPSISETHPKLVLEWDPANPVGVDGVTRGSGQSVGWICRTCGHAWTATVSNRTYNGTGCPACTARRRRRPRRSGPFPHHYSHLTYEWDWDRNVGLDPYDLGVHSKAKVWWRCLTCGHIWIARVASRTVNGTGCPPCARRGDSRPM